MFFFSLLLGAGGFVLNGFGTEVFPGISFLWGGLLYFFAVLAFGPRWGLFAAAIASSRTLLLWGNPYALIVFSLEALVVGWLVERKRNGFVADITFWFLVGFPMVVLIDLVWLDREWGTSLVIITKLPVNSLICVIVVELLLRIGWVQRALGVGPFQSRSQPLRTTLSYVFSLAMVAPLLLFSLGYGNMLMSQLTADAELELETETHEAADNIGRFVDRHRAEIGFLARSLNERENSDLSPDRLDTVLEHFHENFPSFITVIAANNEGTITGSHPTIDPAGVPFRGLARSVADRPYFTETMKRGREYVSDVFRGRGFGHDPIVAIAAPVSGKDGTTWGIVEGSLDLSQFRSMNPQPETAPKGKLLILDEQGRVIYADDTKYEALSTMADSEITKSAMGVEEGRSFLFGYDAASRLDQGLVGVMRTVKVEGMDSPWRAFLYIEASRARAPALKFFTFVMMGLFLMFGLAALLGRWAGGVVTRPLEDLVGSIRGLTLHSSSLEPDLKADGGSSEIVDLVDDFNGMAIRLGQSYDVLQETLKEREALNNQLQELVEELEERVRQRTEELRQSEERLSFALSLSATGGWEYDVQDLSAHRTEFHDKIFGYDPMLPRWDLMVFRQHVVPEDRRAVDRCLLNARKAEGNFRFECRIRRADGEIRWIQVAGGHRLDTTRNSSHFSGIIQDITELKNLEEERRKLEAQILQARKLESLGSMAGGIAHDFNNLLTSILGYADLARLKLAPDSPAKESIDHVIGSARRASELTDKMRAYSGKGRFVVTSLDLNALIGDLAHILNLTVGEDKKLEFELAPDLPLIDADEAQFRQLVMGLVVNAAEATEAGGSITVVTKQEAFDKNDLSALNVGADLPAGDFVVLEVSDNGSGMTAEVMEKMFEPFYSTKFVGRGLGLAAIQGIVIGHRGGISVRSTPGKGTTISVLIQKLDA